GLEYYTGLTFKVYAPGCGAAIGGGGRYDNLIANFGEPEPAVGFSIALDGLVGAISVNDDKLQWRDAGEIQTISFDGDPTRAFEQARQMREHGKQVKIGAK
ncbi:MAG TPA: ATP phosphoribosyltransferase regulatory subunit, partial [Blastocatellia bacterium]|nr:ATP phosphoribosyltransferase regulatory subunit [Blastocatellia bacterium]